jgi:hypothetical protein
VHFDLREKRGSILNLVNEYWGREAFEKLLWLVQSQREQAAIIEGQFFMFGKLFFEDGRFADLPCPCDA